MKYLSFIILLILFTYCLCFSSITINPTTIVFTETKKSIPVTIRNTGTTTLEVSLKIVYGFVASNDSGKPIVVVDSLSKEVNSASEWIKPYPQRFILPVGESQTIRLVAYPPPGIGDGEYWARIIAIGYPQGEVKKTSTGAKNILSGIRYAQGVNLPIFFRKGNLSTGIEIENYSIKAEGNNLIYQMRCYRTGNASFQGNMVIRLVDDRGVVVKRYSKQLVVFKNFFMSESFELGSIVPGVYTVEVEIGSKREYKKGTVVYNQPISFSEKLSIR